MGTLTALDRCDGCPAQAYIVFYKAVNENDEAPAVLQFCGHHSKQHGAELISQGWAVAADETSKLDPQSVAV